MERLEIKKVKGKSYYYYSKWGWQDGKCRRLWQRYLGTAEAVIKKITESEEQKKILYADVFQFGVPIALWNESEHINLIRSVDKLCKKRSQGLSMGKYIALAAINRAHSVVSKQGIWEWFSQTSLIRKFPEISKEHLSSQHFWNNMEKIKVEDCQPIWKEIMTEVLRKEKIDLSSILYDATNYYTFIDTFNAHSTLAKRGKNKQGRSNLRQINYSLFCTADGHVPLLYDTYEGNRNDYSHFPNSLQKFQEFFKGVVNIENIKEKTTLIFDKGNCSKDNFEKIDNSKFHYVTSSKLDEHPELTSIANQDKRFIQCAEDLDRTKAFRVRKQVYGKERVVVVTYNANLFDCQWKTLQTDIEKASLTLLEIRQKIEDRKNGLIKKGKAPTTASVKAQCKEALSREYLKEIITYKIEENSEGIESFNFTIDQEILKRVSDTYLGKNILISSRDKWSDDAIIRGYRSQYIIEDVFKESKDRKTGTWWPQYHWTDSKVHVHALYCTIALLLRALIKRRVENAGVKISMNRLLTELGGIREVVNVYSDQKNTKNRSETVLSKLSETQETLSGILGVTLKEDVAS